VITGGAGFLGRQHGEAIAEMGGYPVIVDLQGGRAEAVAAQLSADFGVRSLGLAADISDEKQVDAFAARVVAEFGRVDILVNNAANDPKPGGKPGLEWSRFESFPVDVWQRDLDVALTGSMLCSRALGPRMAAVGKGVILNIASDLALIGPDQRIYRDPALPEDSQPVKPVSYSVAKAGLLGLTRYLATYWAGAGVRVNSISPGGIYNDQDPAFVRRLADLIPMSRMAYPGEYKAAVVFLVSDASSYMTGANLVVDGGRSAW
jgi:NAD(P)-dependent dehydrogenase (short-subunit alcohol dehydrogenase family)